MVTDWNPLTVWFWNKPYVRFSAADYDETNLDDRFVHLTNNSVGKHSTQEAFGEGNMWYTEELADYLRVRFVVSISFLTPCLFHNRVSLAMTCGRMN